jgi:hypothetical protein
LSLRIFLFSLKTASWALGEEESILGNQAPELCPRLLSIIREVSRGQRCDLDLVEYS